jgi:hypothetical protein
MFDGKMHYEIPPYQRPYVWNEEDQWAPLWADVVRVAESRLVAGGQEPASTPHHFLGAVVYESKPPVVGDVTRHLVIDGQQRTTTLQLMLDAVQAVVEERGHALLAEDLEELILNRGSAFRGKPERFKLWPSRHDRLAFEQAMDPKPNWQGEHRILAAHQFFSEEARTWLTGAPDSDGVAPPGTEEQRAEALCATLQDGLYLVAINLTGHDDSQLIFETLNDRGTPLLKADLIKNWVFQQGERAGAHVEAWPQTHWVDFDDDWWRAEVTQGRLSRSRIDIFIQYWLTMRRSEEVKTEQVFRTFTLYAAPAMATAQGAEELLGELRKDADTYRALSDLPNSSVPGSFYRRVIDTMELAATSPLLMWMLSENHRVPTSQIEVGLKALESWVMRRTLLRMTMKDVNKLMVAILKALDRSKVEIAGETVQRFLATQTADARVWPSDEIMLAQLPSLKLYGNIRQSRLRVVLEAVERKLRSDFHEDVSLPPKLEIEHIMPQGWRTHWNPEPRLSLEDADRRDQRIQTLGNLTLVAKSLNGALSNRPWTDVEAAGMATGGQAGRGKRSLLADYSLLVLSKEIINEHPDAWTDEDIETRGVRLTHHICEVWPGPPVDIVPMDLADFERVDVTQSSDGTLSHVPWTTDELKEVAESSTELTLAFLDYVSVNRDGVPFTGDDLEGSQFVPGQVAGITGALARKTYGNHGRSNPPVEFVNIHGRWHYMMDSGLADCWRSIRGLSAEGRPS